MPRHRIRPTAAFVIIAVALLIVAGWPVFAGAQQPVPTPRGHLGGAEPLATEQAAAPDIQVTTSPTSCEHDPVTLDELVIAASSTPPRDAVNWSGATPATTDQIETASMVIAKLVDCANQNDQSRALALYSPNGLARTLARQGITLQTVELALSSGGPPLAKSALAQMVSIEHVIAADVDHLRATVTLLERSGFGESQMQTYEVEIVRIAGAWLIDDIQPL